MGGWVGVCVGCLIIFSYLCLQSVHITPLPFMCQTYVERYIKIINFFVIRESTSIREVRKTHLDLALALTLA